MRESGVAVVPFFFVCIARRDRAHGTQNEWTIHIELLQFVMQWKTFNCKQIDFLVVLVVIQCAIKPPILCSVYTYLLLPTPAPPPPPLPPIPL